MDKDKGHILVTGGAGFIGSHLVEDLISLGFSVTIYDNLSTGDKENIKNLPCNFVKACLSETDKLKKEVEKSDYIFHLAAMSSVQESMQSPFSCLEENILGTLNILEYSKKSNVKKVILASSAAVYGESLDPIKNEKTTSVDMRSHYGLSKLVGEYYLELYRNQFDLDSASIRFFNVFGERQKISGSYPAVVPKIIDCVKQGKEFTVFGDGQQTRDFIYVKDIVSALIFSAFSDIQGVFNAGYGKKVSINELISIVEKKSEKILIKKHLPPRSGDIKHSMCDPSLLKSKGWSPKFSLEEGIEKLLTK